MARKHTTREAWLNAFIRSARPHFKRLGYPIPEKVRASVGFTSVGKRGKRIGECWTDKCSEDETFEIFIVPSISDPSRIADILTHELAHAAVGLECGHGKPFARCASALGLEGKPTATIAGADWHAWADPILDRIGPLPHATLKGPASSGQPKQSTRMLKAECTECGFTFRVSSKWWEHAGELQCPDPSCCGTVDGGSR